MLLKAGTNLSIAGEFVLADIYYHGFPFKCQQTKISHTAFLAGPLVNSSMGELTRLGTVVPVSVVQLSRGNYQGVVTNSSTVSQQAISPGFI